MSASLVGSEMCIRDRVNSAFSGFSAVSARFQLLFAIPLRGGYRPPDSPKAVSYTHLTLPTICSV
eukprot:12258660-Alexandrium_andersonii.AAC.1